MNYFTEKRLKATGFFKPYTTAGSYALKSTGTGVYIIKHKGQVVYVGMSYKNVRDTLYRHFQTWTDKRSSWSKKIQRYERVTYAGMNREDFLIKVIFCKGNIEAEIMEQLLIKKLKPKDNSLKLYLYSQEQYSKMTEKINNAEGWKTDFKENPF